MFNKDFYPTPEKVVDLMVGTLNIKDSVIYEPHGGSGSLIDSLRKFQPREIISTESDVRLAEITKSKCDRFLGYDCLEIQAEDISHVDFIFMNPPFSKEEDHLLHLYEIAPEGCTIVSLCNWEMCDNRFSRKRSSIGRIIEMNGNCKNIGSVFSDAERKTDVLIGLITIHKPKTGEDEFAGFLDTEEEYEPQENGLMSYSFTREIVGRYIQAMKDFDSVMEVNKRMSDLIAPINPHGMISFTCNIYNRDRGSSDANITRDTFKKNLLRGAWNTLFNKLDMNKYVTKSVTADINKFIEQQASVPFSVKNIQTMLKIIIGTSGSRMNRVVEEAFDQITARYNENLFQLEGWKTNSEYMVNRKFIIGGWSVVDMDFSGNPRHSYSGGSNGNVFDDLTKAMCYVNGQNFDDFKTLTTVRLIDSASVGSCTIRVDGEVKAGATVRIQNNSYRVGSICDSSKGGYLLSLTTSIKFVGYSGSTVEVVERIYKSWNEAFTVDGRQVRWGEWFDFNHFRVKVFKKKSIHAEFKKEEEWVKFNQVAAQTKGFHLASKYTSDFRSKGEGVEIYKTK